jgi:hypothetical protein
MKLTDCISLDFPLIIEQGATFSLPISYKDADNLPVNLSGYTAKMQIRKTPGSEDDPLIDLSTDQGGGISISGTLGIIEVTISAIITKDLPAPWKGTYDLLITTADGLYTERLLSGSIEIIASTTKDTEVEG